VQIAAYKYFNK